MACVSVVVERVCGRCYIRRVDARKKSTEKLGKLEEKKRSRTGSIPLFFLLNSGRYSYTKKRRYTKKVYKTQVNDRLRKARTRPSEDLSFCFTFEKGTYKVQNNDRLRKVMICTRSGDLA